MNFTRKMRIFVGMLFFLLVRGEVNFCCFAQTQDESITITTYYPVPAGVYNDLQSKKFSVGDTNNDGSINAGDLPSNDGDLCVSGSIGIGTTTPQAALDIQGDFKMSGGIVIGNPTGDSQGAGTINVEKIYVNGQELTSLTGGGECGWYREQCPSGWLNLNSPVAGTSSKYMEEVEGCVNVLDMNQALSCCKTIIGGHITKVDYYTKYDGSVTSFCSNCILVPVGTQCNQNSCCGYGNNCGYEAIYGPTAGVYLDIRCLAAYTYYWCCPP